MTMTMTTTVRARMGLILGAALVMTSFGSAAQATYRERCGPNEQTRLETKPCPDPKFTRTRACCTRTVHNGVRTRCKSWPRCPRTSR